MPRQLQMLRKIIKIENTGKLKNCTSTGDTQFGENTVIFGTNGDGNPFQCLTFMQIDP